MSAPQENLLAPSQKVQVDVRLDEIVLRALQKEPELRFQTAHEFSTVVQTLAEQHSASTSLSKRKEPHSEEAPNRPVQKWRKWFPIPWAIKKEGLIMPNWPFIFTFCPVCLFIVWGGINAFFFKPWDSTLLNNYLRVAYTASIILWAFLGYRFARNRLLQKKRLLGLGEKPDHWSLHWTQTFAMAITIAFLIRSFYMSFYVRTDRMSPELEQGSLAFVQRINSRFNQGEIIAYKEGKEAYFGIVAKTKALNSPARNLLVTDHRGKEFNVPIQNVYGRVKFDNSRAKVNQLPLASQTLSLANYDQGLSETAMEELRQNDVESINLTDSALNEEALQLLAQKKNLKNLEIARTISSKAPTLTDEALRIIADCRTLEFIHLHGQDITDDGIRHLANLPNLKKLQLGGTKVTGRRLSELGKLSWLRLDSTPVTDQAMGSIGYLEALEQLYLDGTQISDEGLKHLRPTHLRYLRVLNLHNTQVTANGLAKLKKDFPNLAIGADKDVLEELKNITSKKTTSKKTAETSPTEIAFSKVHQAAIPLLTTENLPWFDLETNTIKTMAEDPEFASYEAEAILRDEVVDFHLSVEPEHPAVRWREKQKVELTGWPILEKKNIALLFSDDPILLVKISSSDFSSITFEEVQTLLKLSAQPVPGTEDDCFAFKTQEGNVCLIQILDRGTFQEPNQPLRFQYRLSN